MPVLAHMRRFVLPLAVVLAIVAIAVPTCRMVGCDMDMGAMRFVPNIGQHFSSVCPGQWEFNSSPTGVIPNGSDPLVLTLIAALVASVVLFSPSQSVRRVLAYVGDPPPPPEDPRGERFRV